MNTFSPIVAGILGLGAAELFVILIILGVLGVGIAGAIWFFATINRGRKEQGHVGIAPQKKCPDCAEVILAEARVCKHCGHKFDAEAA